MATAEYDRHADALYIRLVEAEVSRTVEADEYRVLDFGEDGNVIGIEVLYPSANLVLAPLAREHGFADALPEIDSALEEVFAQRVEPNVTLAIAYVLPASPSTPASVGGMPSTVHTGGGSLTHVG